jgi:uncharacterized protein (TIGR00730 family)
MSAEMPARVSQQLPAPSPPIWPGLAADTPDLPFLAGPRSRLSEFGRAVRIFGEFIRGFRRLHFLGPCVTVFGSARFPQEHRYYRLARQAGAELGRQGFAVMTGGGPGIMEAANRGAREVGATTVGCNITLPREVEPNAYLDVMVEFRHFFVRKVMLVKYSYGFIAFPGGFGTIDEIFETLTLIQTAKLHDFPLILMGADYWQPLANLLRDPLLAQGTIDTADLSRLLITDDPVAAAAAIRDQAVRRFGLRLAAPVRPRWYLGEGRVGGSKA